MEQAGAGREQKSSVLSFLPSLGNASKLCHAPPKTSDFSPGSAQKGNSDSVACRGSREERGPSYPAGSAHRAESRVTATERYFLNKAGRRLQPAVKKGFL